MFGNTSRHLKEFFSSLRSGTFTAISSDQHELLNDYQKNKSTMNNICKRKPKKIPEIKTMSQCKFSSTADLCTIPCQFTGYFEKAGRLEIETNWGIIGAPYVAKVFIFNHSQDQPLALMNMDLRDVESNYLLVMGVKYRVKNLQLFTEIES